MSRNQFIQRASLIKSACKIYERRSIPLYHKLLMVNLMNICSWSGLVQYDILIIFNHIFKCVSFYNHQPLCDKKAFTLAQRYLREWLILSLLRFLFVFGYWFSWEFSRAGTELRVLSRFYLPEWLGHSVRVFCGGIKCTEVFPKLLDNCLFIVQPFCFKLTDKAIILQRVPCRKYGIHLCWKNDKTFVR